MKDWLIKKLGGYTGAEYRALWERYTAIPEVWERAVEAMTSEDRATIINGPNTLAYGAMITGGLVVAPLSNAHIANCYSERSYFPVDRESRIH